MAPLAGTAHLPDLTGLYLRVNGRGEALCELGDTHYLVRGGEVTLWWRDGREVVLREDDSAWVAPFVAHGWSGDGELVKLGSGRHLSYVDVIELSSTFGAAEVLRRARRDRLGWGYDAGAGAVMRVVYGMALCGRPPP
ncbi:hypothetical protein SAMN05216188_14314 [Lentzea xinjiangensis]|uniref:Cyclic nucleotide-binding domain-containing protein n=1 Tax=Lentzea xinjiangensis TaxID=402600 RepID=A0A1H9WTQ9_9PSEU|nr:cupin domain-containing protein [Lentzea xinjiangensis]SES37318.1 hypothetical protein SAMN05216188_14314 [Lentzea xinjiangensis]